MNWDAECFGDVLHRDLVNLVEGLFRRRSVFRRSVPRDAHRIDRNADRQRHRAHQLGATPRTTKILARTLLAGFGLLVLAFGLVPWQQSSTGAGRVIAYAPVERQQVVEAPVEGRVVRWHVREGDHVELGDPFCDLSDNDPDILVRLRQERDAQLARIGATKARRESRRSVNVSSLVKARF